MSGRHSGQAPSPLDVAIGRRMRMRRLLLGMTQRQIAARLGLTFQQIQKYECAATRISASRLYEIAQLLQVPASYFFEDTSVTVRLPLHDGGVGRHE